MGRIGNIINRKGKQDAKRASVFTKHARAITVAAKEGGADPEDVYKRQDTLCNEK